MFESSPSNQPLGLIAGNGRFPFLVLEEALKQGIPLVVAAIREETDPELESFAGEKAREAATEVSFHWLGLGQLGKLIRLFRQERVTRAVMAGQVRHVQIFAPQDRSWRRRLSALPDWRMSRLLLSLPRKDTSALIGAVVGELEKQGIRILESTFLLKHLLPSPGVLSRRPPNQAESRDIAYGRPIAKELARLDVGQTLVVKDQAVVAVEAMEGTDETIRRAARLVGGQRLTVIKVSRPQQDMRFDVPVLGLRTLRVLRECHVTALAIDAGRTLLLDQERFLEEADALELALVACEP